MLEEVAKATQLDVESVRLDFFIFFCGPEFVGHSFACVAYFLFLRNVNGFEPRDLP